MTFREVTAYLRYMRKCQERHAAERERLERR